MEKRPTRTLLAVLALLVAGACGSDEYSAGRPADMGAGRPDTGAPSSETPATEVLQGVGSQSMADTSAIVDSAQVDTSRQGSR